MLKKFNQFVDDNISQPKVEEKSIVQPKKEVKVQPKIETPSFKKEPKIETPKAETKKAEVKETVSENLNSVVFTGKIAQFPFNTKPSDNLKLLENFNIDKNKLHYIVSEHLDNALVIVKYNPEGNIKLNEFVTTLIEYYKRNESLKNIFSKIVVEGTEQYSIIKNIPDVDLGGKKLIRILNNDLVNLLK